MIYVKFHAHFDYETCSCHCISRMIDFLIVRKLNFILLLFIARLHLITLHLITLIRSSLLQSSQTNVQ